MNVYVIILLLGTLSFSCKKQTEQSFRRDSYSYSDFGQFKLQKISCQMEEYCIDFIVDSKSTGSVSDKKVFDEYCSRLKAPLSLSSFEDDPELSKAFPMKCTQKKYGCLNALADATIAGETLYMIKWFDSVETGNRCYWQNGTVDFSR